MFINHEGSDPSTKSQLFTLRMWSEETGNQQTDLRGKVQHVNSGEVCYFRDWSIMENFIEGLLGNFVLHIAYLDDVEDTGGETGNDTQ